MYNLGNNVLIVELLSYWTLLSDWIKILIKQLEIIMFFRFAETVAIFFV